MPDDEVRNLLRIAYNERLCSPPRFSGNNSQEQALEEIVGLEEAKRVLKQIIAYHRLQVEAKKRGVVLPAKRYHMCFVGNPGTAKTTFARACAMAFQLEGILLKNVFMEVGRAELIASYSGQTAPKVKNAFDAASGGILFVDEAYSLVEDAEGGYGDEAIAAIVQEMENRKDVIVIFAGYPDKMEVFLSRNPGLKSRIPFTVHFPDYTSEELVKIAKIMATKGGFQLSPDSEVVIKNIVNEEQGKPDFGNARFVRNLVEIAQMNRACASAYKRDFSYLPDSELFILQARDFERPHGIITNDNYERKIGFV
jgi:SpoVK/Ycf46/Vps4 family AAA+-type ATPase